MGRSSYSLSGRVTRSDNQQGVFGLHVEVHDADAPGAPPLAHALTASDGTYHVEVPLGEERACCDCPSLYIVLRDRDCRLVHDGCTERRCCQPGEPLRIDVSLAPQALWWHLSRPLAWQRIDEPLLPPQVMQEIEDTIELLRAEGVPAAQASLALAECASPALRGFDRVLLDAWGTLQGDLAAGRRYREVLDALASENSGCGCHGPAPFDAEVDALFEAACTPREPGCVPPAPCAPCGEGDCDDAGCHCGAPFLSEDKVMLLLFAALHLACGDSASAKRHVKALLAQFCRFGTLAALHGAARSALLGDAAAKAHARDLLEWLARCCTPCEPKSACAPCLAPGIEKCLRAAIAQWCEVECWHVCEVRPPRACPGEEILIVGCGFGARPGRVRFRPRGGITAELPGVIKSWCDDRIVVVVPQGAGCGLSIELPPQTLSLCGRFLELRPFGCIEHGFEGTAAEIERFDIKGHAGTAAGECPLQPGEPLRIRWATCAADRVRVEIIDLANNAVIAALDPAAASGRWDFEATHFTRTTRLRVRITAFGRCEPPQVSRQIDLVFQRRPNLQVQGLEVTQAVQHYRAAEHLTDPADRGPDNSLRLVTNKTAWVRSYLRSGQDPAFDSGQLAGVSGTLRVERRTAGVWSTIATLAPQNGPVTAEDSHASYGAERGNINTTLNFVVPAALMTGLLRFTVDAQGPFPKCPGQRASASTQVDVNLRQTLNAAFITIGYDGPNAARTGNITLPAPTLATCQAETSWALTTYPVDSVPNVRIAGSFVTNTPIDDPRSCDGCCSPNWGPLLTQIGALVALDQAAHPGETWAYYGIIASGIPVNVPGCSGGATGGVAGQPVTYAHEIGHQFGLPHARCGNAGNGNPAYTIYEPYDLPVDPPATTNWTMASIGEYGLDINSGAIADPNDFEDFMSYCGPRWISKFTHDFLVNHANLTPQVIPTGAGAPRVIHDGGAPLDRDETAIEPLILLMGTLKAEGGVEVASVARLETRYLRGNGRRTGYVAQHLDAEGRVLAEDVLYGYVQEGGCGCGGHGGDKDDAANPCGGDAAQPVPFKAMLRDSAPGAALRILKCGEVVWERQRPERACKLGGVRAAVGKNGEVELSWKLDGAARQKGEDVQVWARWSSDEGKTWHALSVGLRGGHATLPAEALPGGTALRIELLANDGFDTQRAVSEPLTLPPRAPAVTILHPAAGTPVYGDRQIHLWGSASSAGDHAEWFIDGRSVGRGLDLWVDNPGAGRHELRLVVRDGMLQGEAALAFEVLATD